MNINDLIPFWTKILVKVINLEEKGWLSLPETEEKPSVLFWEVLKVGNGVKTFKEGMVVLFDRYKSNYCPIPWDFNEYRFTMPKYILSYFTK